MKVFANTALDTIRKHFMKTVHILKTGFNQQAVHWLHYIIYADLFMNWSGLVFLPNIN